MNTLSWLIYLAGVVGFISSLAWFVVVVSGLILVVFEFSSFLLSVNNYAYSNVINKDVLPKMKSTDELTPEVKAGLSVWFRRDMGRTFRHIAVWFFFAILAGLIPSQRTMYMITASEMGETVVSNPEAVQVYNALKDTVLDYLEVPKKSD